MIQKRSKLKNGKYATTGGHPKSGENSVQGIISEIKEEIGLDINPKDLKLYYSGRSDLMNENKFFKNHYEEFEILLNWLKKGNMSI